MVKNEAGEFYDLTFTTCFLTSEKHNFGVHTDKSPKICTHVEQIFLYKAGLLLNIDVAVPFLESKNIADQSDAQILFIFVYEIWAKRNHT